MDSEAGAEPGRAALQTLDAILAREPEPDQALFSKATQQLSAFRNALIAAGPAARTRLEHVSAVISIVMAGHFPLGKLPWAELHKARDWLAGAVE